MAGAELERLGLVTALLPDQTTMRAAAMAEAAPLSLRAAKAAFFELARRPARSGTGRGPRPCLL
jgi:enoyl-CoA hydratase/carnithine racemase